MLEEFQVFLKIVVVKVRMMSEWVGNGSTRGRTVDFYNRGFFCWTPLLASVKRFFSLSARDLAG
jgi:hypothetical protein